LVVIPVPLLAKTYGQTGRALNICGGTMSKPNPEQDILQNGRTRIFTRAVGI
jgi:hypothetical protein